MFLSEDALNKYSLFGKFENHIKYSIFRQDHEDESKFEVLPFLNYCEKDTKWYHTLMDVMIDKQVKLVTSDGAKKPLPHPSPVAPTTSHLAVPTKKEELTPAKDVVQKAKKEPPKSKQDDRTIEIMRGWYPLRFKLNYPKKSALSSYEQKEFIDLFKRFQNRTHLSQKEVKLYKLYVHYRNLIEKERVAFLEYSKQYFQHASEDYQFVNETTVQYINEMIDYLEHEPSRFSRYFTRLDELAIDHVDMNKANFELEKSLVQLGNIPKIILPSVTAHPSLTIAYTPISKRAPVSKLYKKLTKIPINEDPNAEKLALKYQANIVMTNSAFVHLVYHLAKQNEDDLKMPVIIKYLVNPSDKTSQKTVFIDKPFVSKRLNQRDKNDKFYKRSLMVTLVKHQIVTRNYKKQQSISQAPNESTEQLDQTTDDRKELKPSDVNTDYEAENKLESFGVYNESAKEDELSLALSKKRPIETPTKDTDELEAKKFKQSDPSPNSTKPNEKKPSETLDNDYEEYDTDSENEGLQIVTDNINNSNNETPASPTNEAAEKKQEAINEPSPEEPDTTNYDKVEIKPIAIPLEKLPEKTEKVEPKPTTSKQATSTTSVNETKKPTEESSLTLLDLISKMQEKLITASTTASKTPVQHILSNLAPASKASQQQPAENVRDYTYIENIHDNVSYNLWVISGPKPVRILVRSSVPGYVNTESSSRSSVVLHSRLEYQPQFGCEKLTHKDYCFMWAKSFVRNLCDVILCRINVFTNRLINVKTLNHKDILTGCITFNPQQSLNYLRNLFEKFNKYEIGEYLLTKEPNEKKITIMKSTSIRTTFDLHQFYMGFEAEKKEKKPEFIPLDPDIYLPYHNQLHRVPCTFEPADSGYSKNVPKGAKQASKSKRKNRSKNKKSP